MYNPTASIEVCCGYFVFQIRVFKIYFIFGCAGSSLLCTGSLQLWRAGATSYLWHRASHCDGFFSCGAQAPGAWASVVVVRGPLVVAHGPQSVQASVIVVHGLSSSVACGIFQDQGSNPCPLHWQANSYPLYHQRNL